MSMANAQADDNTPNNATASGARMDFTSPLYLHPTENASTTLLPSVFDGSGYRSWRRAFLRALSVKNKTGFINGKIVSPGPDDPGFAQWERCDNMVTSWILNSISPDLRDSLQYVNNTEELWKELEDRYDQTNECKLYQLQKEINDLVQGSLDVTGYYTKMKKLWEEMNTIDVGSQCTCVCTCGGKVKMHKAEQDRRPIHFLMGLNEVYTAIRGNILTMSVLPSMAHAFAILLQEEKQNEVKPYNQTILESTSLNASVAGGTKPFRTNYNSHRGPSNSRGPGNPMFRGSSGSGNSHMQGRSNMFCKFCKRTGHAKERWYKLHGYPPGSRISKGKGSASAAHVQGSEAEGSHNASGQMPVNLTKDQYEQLLNLLGTLQVGNAGDGTGNMLSGAVNLAENDSGGNFLVYTRWGRVGSLAQREERRSVVPICLSMMPHLSLRVNSMRRPRTIGLTAKIFFCQPKHYTWLEMDYAENGKDSSVQGQSNLIPKCQPR